MTYETEIKKSRQNGWTAKTNIELEKLEENKTRILQINTWKGRTSAGVVVLEDYGTYTSETFTMFEDYRQNVCNNDIKRNTEKAIETAHAEALKLIAPHIEAAKAQYNIA